MSKSTKNKKEDINQTLLAKAQNNELLKQVLKKSYEEDNIQLEQVIKIFQGIKQELSIPLSIFSHHLHPAEALCKYLKENEHLSNREIAQLLSRNNKSVWATYQRAIKKKKIKFIKKQEKYFLPISVFQNRSYSFLEAIIHYLNSVYHLTNPEIGKLLSKSANSMAVLAKRAREKSE